MNYTLENDYLFVTISSAGAEVQSVWHKQERREMWWQGDSRYWGGRSPILFPACGGLWNGEYTCEGKTYQMTKHGYVRKQEWQCEQRGDALSFYVESNEDTKKIYPFDYRLTVTYRLEGKTLLCHAEVKNLCKGRDMWYQIGGHPALALDIENEMAGYLRLTAKDGSHLHARLLSLVRAGEQGCWSRDRYAVPYDEDGMVPVSTATFAHEALIFDNAQIGGVDVLDAKKQFLCHVSSDSPVWLFWQPQGLLSPFVCAEPWYGLCDLQGQTVSIDKRPYIQHVAAEQINTHKLWQIDF